jgi:hypothetical protein
MPQTIKVTASSENIKGIAIIDGAGVVHRFAVPAGAKDWLTIRGSITVGLFDEMVWETGQPPVVSMTAEELDGVQSRRVSFLPIPNEPTNYAGMVDDGE